MTVSPTDEIADSAPALETEVKTGVDAAESPPANDGDAADSPPAKDGAKADTLIDRIKQAADKVGGESSPGSESEGTAQTVEPAAKPQGESEGDAGEFTKDDLARLHSKTRIRVQKLLSEKDNLHKEIDQLKPAVDGYANIIGFLKTNDLSFDDAHQAFDILKNIRHNPGEALKQLLPLVEQLQQITGAVLPNDLADQVRQGYITEGAAEELARLRASQSLSQTQAERDRDLAARRGAEQQERLTVDIQKSLSTLESEWASSDPDYSKKREDIQDMFKVALYEAKMANKLPPTVDAAIALAKTVKEKVDGRIRKFQPRKEEIRHVTGSSAPNVRPKAKSLQDAIMQAVG